jgi:hypothetical protein
MGHTARITPDRAPRFPMEVPVQYRRSGTLHWLQSRTVNISRTGILFHSEMAIPAASMLDVRVEFPTHASLECQCTVVRTEPSFLAVQIRRHNLLHK